MPLTIASRSGRSAWLLGRLVLRTRPAREVVSAMIHPFAALSPIYWGRAGANPLLEPRRAAPNCAQLPQTTCGFAKVAGQEAMLTLTGRGSRPAAGPPPLGDRQIVTKPPRDPRREERPG